MNARPEVESRISEYRQEKRFRYLSAAVLLGRLVLIGLVCLHLAGKI